MDKPQMGSIKHNLITKANKRVVIATAVAAFIVTFSLVSCYILIKQMSYQNKVIGARKAALHVAEDSLSNVETLRTAYAIFDKKSPNILGGANDSNAKGEKDGTNSKIILDALPAVYNFPALATSIEKIVLMNKLEFVSINGSDDAIAQQQNTTSSAPTPIEMPLEFSVKGSYASTQSLINDLERSIRPFQIISIEIGAEGGNGEITTKVTGKTYFQPQKNLNLITEKVQ